MAAAGGSSKRTWVVDVEKKLKEAGNSSASRWERHCIYRVPPCMTNIKSKAYQPQVVSLGPFHHGDLDLRPMEEHSCGSCSSARSGPSTSSSTAWRTSLSSSRARTWTSTASGAPMAGAGSGSWP
ncbi:hypothetical protein TRIUR3_11334 [Triticum urartu]|uniref:Uncharacterized protein n=1 Tax=Triticum urartu TaxID=4572 RepID=M7YV95_TRIUA|nr:hypothetical protein TRIUR3_11334 [Triticum urartu]